MGIVDLFSKRRKCELGRAPDVFSYSEIPQPLRVQIIHIWRRSIGESSYMANYRHVVQTLCEEYGQFRLANNIYDSPSLELETFFLAERDVAKVIDVIEQTFKIIDRIRSTIGNEIADEAIDDLNEV